VRQGQVKRIFLIVLIMLVLLLAWLGGILAGFSGTEIYDNSYLDFGAFNFGLFPLGSHNGTAINNLGTEHGNLNPTNLIGGNEILQYTSWDISFDSGNIGGGGGAAEPLYAYIQFNNFQCSEVFTNAYPLGRPEPERVAEEGGRLAGVTTSPLGPVGQNCTLKDFVEVYIEFDTNQDGVYEPILGNPAWGAPDTVYLGQLDCWWISLGQVTIVPNGNGQVSMHLGQWSEEMWNGRFGTTLNYFSNDLPFNDWPTNAFMLDKVTYNVDLLLTQTQIPPEQVWPGV